MTTVALCTWNAGSGSKEDLERLMARFNVIAGQEWGDRDDLTRFAERRRWQVVTGEQPGVASTPLLVAPNVRVRRRVAIPMLPAMNVGPGAGPDRSKPKWAVGGLLQANGEIFGAVSTHLVASQQNAGRRKAASIHIKNLIQAFDHRKFPWFVLGDFNCTPQSSQLNPMYRAGWTNTATKDHPLPTHGSRCIDYVWWQRTKDVSFQKQHAYRTRSDHDALGAAFRLR